MCLLLCQVRSEEAAAAGAAFQQLHARLTVMKEALRELIEELVNTSEVHNVGRKPRRVNFACHRDAARGPSLVENTRSMKTGRTKSEYSECRGFREVPHIPPRHGPGEVDEEDVHNFGKSLEFEGTSTDTMWQTFLDSEAQDRGTGVLLCEAWVKFLTGLQGQECQQELASHGASARQLAGGRSCEGHGPRSGRHHQGELLTKN